MYNLIVLKIRKKIIANWPQMQLFAFWSLLFLSSCQQEPCTGGTIPWFGVQVYIGDTLRTNAIAAIRGVGTMTDANLTIGSQRQYLLQLNPGADSCSYSLTLNNRANAPTINLHYTKKPVLISERCGFGFNYNSIRVKVSGVDSARLTKDFADSTRGTNLIIWIR